MLSWLYPTVVNKNGMPVSMSLFGFQASDSLVELKALAAEKAVREADRQYIVRYATDKYVLFHTYWKGAPCFKDKPIVARFAASGKETTRKERTI